VKADGLGEKCTAIRPRRKSLMSNDWLLSKWNEGKLFVVRWKSSGGTITRLPFEVPKRISRHLGERLNEIIGDP